MLKDKIIQVKVFDTSIVKPSMKIEFTICNTVMKATIQSVYSRLLEVVDENGYQRYFDTDDVELNSIRIVNGG